MERPSSVKELLNSMSKDDKYSDIKNDIVIVGKLYSILELSTSIDDIGVVDSLVKKFIAVCDKYCDLKSEEVNREFNAELEELGLQSKEANKIMKMLANSVNMEDTSAVAKNNREARYVDNLPDDEKAVFNYLNSKLTFNTSVDYLKTLRRVVNELGLETMEDFIESDIDVEDVIKIYSKSESTENISIRTKHSYDDLKNLNADRHGAFVAALKRFKKFKDEI